MPSRGSGTVWPFPFYIFALSRENGGRERERKNWKDEGDVITIKYLRCYAVCSSKNDDGGGSNVFRRLTRGRRYVDTNEDERAEPVRTTPSLATLADEMTPSAFRTNSFLIHFPPAGHEGGGALDSGHSPTSHVRRHDSSGTIGRHNIYPAPKVRY